MPVKKGKGKNWFTIIAPKYFNEKEIGKTLIGDSSQLIGRIVMVSVSDLTNNFSKYYVKFSFKVDKINDNKALTKFYGSECLRDYISRMVRTRVTKIDTIQDLTTKDGIKIRVKGLAIIPRRIKSSIKQTVRNKVRELLESIITNLTLEQFIKQLISDEIKNKVIKEGRRTYPIRNFEIRKSELLTK